MGKNGCFVNVQICIYANDLLFSSLDKDMGIYGYPQKPFFALDATPFSGGGGDKVRNISLP
jgi:hypothetical protein